MDSPKPNIQLARKLELYATIFSIAVLLLVIAMRYVSLDISLDVMILPPFHAIINTLTALCLILALFFVKRGNIKKHMQSNILALVFSAIFLVSYVVYHVSTEPTTYGGEGYIRILYYVLLATHVFLAAASLPFILFTFIRAYTGQVDRHKKMARWVFPVWLYVAITGPICYLMLAPYY